jgi:hypothetical protein
MNRLLATLSFLAAATLLAGPARAGDPAALDGPLTPVGAERAGNRDGSIPAWDGGLTAPPAGLGYTPGKHHPDPYAADAPIATITQANAAGFAELLADGQRELMRIAPTYSMKLYPTRRSCAFPQFVYDATRRNAGTARLDPNTGDVSGAYGGFPFAQPTQGFEVIRNHILRYRGYRNAMTYELIQVASDGSVDRGTVRDTSIHDWSHPTPPADAATKERVMAFLSVNVHPAQSAGQITLVVEPLNYGTTNRKAWLYNPGVRRVQRAPLVEFDNPIADTNGMQTYDQYDVFNGSPERYRWTLVGKREMIVPYNTYAFASPSNPPETLVGRSHLNQDLLRYERHRVWVVEADLKEGVRHVYAKRRFFVDEDSWSILFVELYDARGGLWRLQEGHLINFYEVPACYYASHAFYDLNSGEFLLDQVANATAPRNWAADDVREQDFAPDRLASLGVR